MKNAIFDASGELYDHIREQFSLRSDLALAEWLGQPAPMVSKVRHSKAQVNAQTIINIMDKTDWSLALIRSMLPKPAKASRKS